MVAQRRPAVRPLAAGLVLLATLDVALLWGRAWPSVHVVAFVAWAGVEVAPAWAMVGWKDEGLGATHTGETEPSSAAPPTRREAVLGTPTGSNHVTGRREPTAARRLAQALAIAAAFLLAGIALAAASPRISDAAYLWALRGSRLAALGVTVAVVRRAWLREGVAADRAAGSDDGIADEDRASEGKGPGASRIVAEPRPRLPGHEGRSRLRGLPAASTAPAAGADGGLMGGERVGDGAGRDGAVHASSVALAAHEVAALALPAGQAAGLLGAWAHGEPWGDWWLARVATLVGYAVCAGALVWCWRRG